MAKILIVDDNREWRENLSEFLIDLGYEVMTAANGEEAIRLIDTEPPDLILSDLLMPGIDGFELCRYVRSLDTTPNIPFIFSSGFFPINEQQELSKLLDVEDFFDKPVEFEQLTEAIERNLSRISGNSKSEEESGDDELFTEAHEELVRSKLWNAVERERRQRERAEALAARLEKNLESLISTVSKAIEARDPYTAGHERRVAKLACAMAEEMGLPANQITGIRYGSLIHDIGKIHLPSELLAKPSKLTPIEFEVIKTHAEVGYRILEGIDFPWPIAEIAYQHHERIDGSGYPQGLRGDTFILDARIVAVADVTEAMASHRPYRPALGIDAAIEEIKAHRGTFYDPAAVDACLSVLDKDFSFEEPGEDDQNS